MINRYCIQSNKDYVEYLLLEDQAIYMNFFDWMFKTSRKKLLQSYDEYWRRLCQYFGLFARRRVNGEVHEQMRRVCKLSWPNICKANVGNSFSNMYSLQSARSPGV
jgi:hypothetical protein